MFERIYLCVLGELTEKNGCKSLRNYIANGFEEREYVTCLFGY